MPLIRISTASRPLTRRGGPTAGLHRQVPARAAPGTAIPKVPEPAYAPEPATVAEFTEAEGQHAIG